jgi:hypothetical protein
VKIGNPSERLHIGNHQPFGPLASTGKARVKGNDVAVDAGRVEKMKAAITGGTFAVNAAVVAAKLISANLDALARMRSSPAGTRSTVGAHCAPPATRN